MQYVERASLMLDLRILLMTVWKVIARQDVVADPDTIEQWLSDYRQKTPAELQGESCCHE